MKLRHAAALALVGWYLMFPPWNKAGDALVLDAPLSQWRTISSFDTAKECSADRAEHYGKALYPPPDSHPPPLAVAMLAASHCIASDDPRLVK